MVKGRIRVGVLAGGASAERRISLLTGAQVAAALPADRYDVVLLDPLALMAGNPRLSEDQRARGQALLTGGTPPPEASDRELPADLRSAVERASAALVPATRGFGAASVDDRIDVAFIALHGPYGEDGRIQGVLDTLGIPYTGSGVLASALAMDKVMAKRVLTAAGLRVPRGAVVRAAGLPDEARTFGPPWVVKPVANGSSFGVSMVDAEAALPAAIAEALGYDERVLVEERLRGTELTCGVIGNDDLTALPVVEIVPKRAFFDYRAKYDPSQSDEICPARIPDELAREVQRLSLAAHRALGCRGLSRTDLIAAPDGLVVLEVNTMPGLTQNSLLPKAARAAGIPFDELVQRLVGWALERAK